MNLLVLTSFLVFFFLQIDTFYQPMLCLHQYVKYTLHFHNTLLNFLALAVVLFLKNLTQRCNAIQILHLNKQFLYFLFLSVNQLGIALRLR